MKYRKLMKTISRLQRSSDPEAEFVLSDLLTDYGLAKGVRVRFTEDWVTPLYAIHKKTGKDSGGGDVRSFRKGTTALIKEAGSNMWLELDSMRGLSKTWSYQIWLDPREAFDVLEVIG